MFQEKEYVSDDLDAAVEHLLDGERTFTLLDVREQREYEAGHLLGAVNLPYEELDEVEADSERPPCGHLLRLRGSEPSGSERTCGRGV